ncbi:MAG: hypothetical protein ABI633_09080 [Burkholderiales bacterium]
MQAALLALASQGEHAGQVAKAASALWGRVDAELSPVFGSAGVAALYRRSLYRARAESPALAEVYDATEYAKGREPLRLLLASLSHDDAVVASRALMRAFCELLIELIGAPLAEQLLKPATDLEPREPREPRISPVRERTP